MMAAPSPVRAPQSTLPSSPLSQAPSNPIPPTSPLSQLPSSPPWQWSRKRASSLPAPSTDSESNISSNTHAPRQRRRVSTKEKLHDIIRLIRGHRWTIKEFLYELRSSSGSHSLRRAYTQFLDTAYGDFVQSPDFEEMIGPARKSGLIKHHSFRWTAETLRAEVIALAAEPAFGDYNPPINPKELGSLEAIPRTSDAIRSRAPYWLELIERASKPEGTGGIDIAALDPSGRHMVILSILCHTCRPKKSTNIPSILGLYLYHGGARRRVLEFLGRMDLTK